jgi:RHS repeat-associated protein
VAALVDAANGTVAARYEHGPFAEPLRVTGPLAKANPIRFSTKCTDAESGLLYYGYRYYNPSTARWLSRDPIGELGGRNLYNFIQNDSVNGVDFVGLCKVHAHGFRYRVSIAALDAHQVGTPYADLAKFAKNFLDTHPNYQPLQMTAPNLTSSGPFTFSNPALNGGQIPAGTYVAAHFLFYVDWEIDETDGPCGLNVSETGTIQRGNNPPQPGPPRSGPAPAGTWTKADRKQPLGTCTKTLIFVDAPGSRAYLIRVPGIPATFGGFTQTVNHKFDVVNQKTGAIVHTSSHSVTIGLTDSGGLIANP